MNVVFVDTSFYAAVINRRDQWHALATEVGSKTTGPMVTTEFVLLEVANFCLSTAQRAVFLRLVANLRNAAAVEIVPANAGDFQRGLDLFAARSDKEWSLTDCISFQLMRDRGLTQALTADEHFEQAGFEALLRQVSQESGPEAGCSRLVQAIRNPQSNHARSLQNSR